jgi:hypothetical protein
VDISVTLPAADRAARSGSLLPRRGRG